MVSAGAPEGYVVPTPQVAPVVLLCYGTGIVYYIMTQVLCTILCHGYFSIQIPIIYCQNKPLLYYEATVYMLFINKICLNQNKPLIYYVATVYMLFINKIC
jgi:hypothetical protein